MRYDKLCRQPSAAQAFFEVQSLTGRGYVLRRVRKQSTDNESSGVKKLHHLRLLATLFVVGKTMEGEVDVKEFDTETLVSETDKLLRMGIDELYATLGAQLLVFAPPTRAAGITSYLSAVRSASEANLFLEGLAAGPSLTEWATGLGLIHEELKAQGKRYLTEKREDLREALCNQDILAWSDDINRSTIQILITIVGGTLRMPRELDSISATTLAIILKLGLRTFCC
jgi:hypothetical protein